MFKDNLNIIYYWFNFHILKNAPYFYIGLEYEDKNNPSHYKFNCLDISDYSFRPRHFKKINKKIIINKQIIDSKSYINYPQNYDYELQELYKPFSLSFNNIECFTEHKQYLQSLNEIYIVFYSPLESSTRKFPMFGSIHLKLNNLLPSVIMDDEKISITIDNFCLDKCFVDDNNITKEPCVILSDEQVHYLKGNINSLDIESTEVNEIENNNDNKSFEEIWNINIE